MSCIIIKIITLISYEHSLLFRLVLHLIWLIIQKKRSKFAWAKLLHVPITLTFKALSAGVSLGYTLRWALTFGIFYRSETAMIGLILGLSRIPSALGLIIWNLSENRNLEKHLSHELSGRRVQDYIHLVQKVLYTSSRRPISKPREVNMGDSSTNSPHRVINSPNFSMYSVAERVP